MLPCWVCCPADAQPGRTTEAGLVSGHDIITSSVGQGNAARFLLVEAKLARIPGGKLKIPGNISQQMKLFGSW